MLACALFAKAGLSGADTTRDTSYVMARIDPDADGIVTVSEAKNVALARSTTLDTDGDGRRNINEPTGIAGTKAMLAADTDRDGMLSRSEYPRHGDERIQESRHRQGRHSRQS